MSSVLCGHGYCSTLPSRDTAPSLMLRPQEGRNSLLFFSLAGGRHIASSIPGGPSSLWCFTGESKRHVFLSHHLEPALPPFRFLERLASMSRWGTAATDSRSPSPHLHGPPVQYNLVQYNGVEVRPQELPNTEARLNFVFILDKQEEGKRYLDDLIPTI